MSSSEDAEVGQPLRTAFEQLQADVISESPEKAAAAIPRLEAMTRDVSMLGLFGQGDVVAELPTASLPFLALPALLAFATATAASDPTKRAAQLGKAQLYWRDFLRRLRDYAFAEELLGRGEAWEEGAAAEEEEAKPGPSSSPSLPQRPSIAELERRRNAKIARLRERTELESRMEARVEGKTLDEETERDHCLARLRWWILKGLAEMELVAQELPMLRLMAERAAQTGAKSPEEEKAAKAATAKKPWRPLIIARDDAQKAVFGAGYPSYYTMSVREYMDMTHHLHKGPAQHSSPQGEAEEEEMTDEELHRLRALDEYKDFHRRGWGNTHNKG